MKTKPKFKLGDKVVYLYNLRTYVINGFDIASNGEWVYRVKEDTGWGTGRLFFYDNDIMLVNFKYRIIVLLAKVFYSQKKWRKNWKKKYEQKK